MQDLRTKTRREIHKTNKPLNNTSSKKRGLRLHNYVQDKVLTTKQQTKQGRTKHWLRPTNDLGWTPRDNGQRQVNSPGLTITRRGLRLEEIQAHPSLEHTSTRQAQWRMRDKGTVGQWVVIWTTSSCNRLYQNPSSICINKCKVQHKCKRGTRKQASNT